MMVSVDDELTWSGGLAGQEKLFFACKLATIRD